MERFYDRPPGSSVIVRVIRPIDRAFMEHELLIELKSIEQAEKDIRNLCPLIITRAGITLDILDNPQMAVVVENASEKRITGFKISAETFNNFGEPVLGIGNDNQFRGISQTTIEPDGEELCKWSLTFRDTTTEFHAHVYHVKFGDGSEWMGKGELIVARRGED